METLEDFVARLSTMLVVIIIGLKNQDFFLLKGMTPCKEVKWVSLLL